MESMLSTLAFTVLIGAQFLGAIVLISKRKEIYEGLKHLKSTAPSDATAIDPHLPAEA